VRRILDALDCSPFGPDEPELLRWINWSVLAWDIRKIGRAEG
jgi:hypothetical protein